MERILDKGATDNVDRIQPQKFDDWKRNSTFKTAFLHATKTIAKLLVPDSINPKNKNQQT